MPEFNLPEDEAVLYVLGELTGARREEFEARMAQSTELRALVRQLEEGAAALSMASPQRRLPAAVWKGIEKRIKNEKPRETIFSGGWIRWWRSGWAVAAASLAGWMFYAILVNWRATPRAEKPQAVSEQESNPNGSTVENKPARAPSLKTLTNTDGRLVEIRAEDVGRLHREIAELEKQTTQLSALLVQQHALLGESNRIKFYHLVPGTAGVDDASTARLSPALQRAIFLSVGRQLGWLPADTAVKQENGGSHAQSQNFDGVNFVDLQPTNSAPVAQSSPAPPPADSQTTNAPTPTIPAFVSGNNLVVAVDSSVVPTNSLLSLMVTDGNGATYGGEVFFGETPTVITIPCSVGINGGNGWIFTIGTFMSSGQSNFTQFFNATNP